MEYSKDYEIMKMIKIDNCYIRFIDTYGSKGNKPDDKSILLLHGLGGSLERWSKVIPFFSNNYRLIIPDIVGFGYSDKPHVEYSIEFFIKFIENFIQALNIDNLYVIGSSFGGLLALEFAIKFPKKVNKLVLLSPAGMMNRVTPTLNLYISAALYPTFYNVATAYYEMVYDPRSVTEASIRDFINRMSLNNAKYAFMSTLISLKNNPDLKDRLKINIPTLLIWGKDDQLMPLKYAKDFKIPNSKLVIFNNCGHYPHVEKVEEFNKTVFQFLNNDLYNINEKGSKTFMINES
ncbi:MAG: alpha/beta hydrolase [Nitrososphaeraceae archaeon]|nr:alpha/beta hydrolase [Nitrososphaeraceae archaeon]